MQDDERCCGTGTCIIDAQGHCWCGQQWDGEKMCRPVSAAIGAAALLPDNRGTPIGSDNEQDVSDE